MKKILVILFVLIFAVASAYADTTTNSEQQTDDQSQTTVASATSSTATVTTVKKKVPEIVKAESNWSASLLNRIIGTNYYTIDEDTGTYYYLVPGVGYKIPSIPVSLGSEIVAVSKLNNIDNYGNHKMDIDYVDVYADAKLWKNKSGTSLKAFVEYDMEMLSTKEHAWLARKSSAYANMSLYQAIGSRTTLRMRPSLIYQFNPNNEDVDFGQRRELELAAFRDVTKNFSIFYKQKYRKYIPEGGHTATSGTDNWLVYSIPGFSLSRKNLSLSAYLYMSDTTQRRVWTQSALEKSTTFIDLGYSF